MRKLLALLILLAAPAWAATYYVDNCDVTGNDSNNGTSTSTPWLTINKVNTSSFSAGDSILFKKGCTWREQLTVPSSGSAGSPITFGAYGSGAKPIINGSTLITPGTSWSHDDDLGEESGGIFASGLEHEVDAFTTDFTGKTTGGTNTVVVTTAVKNHGAKGGIITYGGGNFTAHAYKTISDQTDIYVRAYVRFDAAWTNGGNWSGTPILSLRDESSGQNLLNLKIRSQASGGALANCTWHLTLVTPATDIYIGTLGDIAADTWYRVEIRWVGHATTGGGQFWLDGVSKGSNYTKDTSGYAADRIEVGGASSSYGTAPTAGSIMYFDDVKADSSAVGDYSAGGDPANVWKATVATAPALVMINGTHIGDKKATLGVLVNEYDWYHDGATTLYLYSATDPDTAYTSPGVEVGARDRCIEGNGKDYLTFSDLVLASSNSIGLFSQDSNFVTLSDCEIAYAYSAGVYLWATGATHNIGHVFSGCDVHDNGSNGLYIGNYGSASSIISNSAYNNCWNTAEDTNAGIKIYSGPYGSEDSDNNSGHTIERNLVYSNGVASGNRGAGIWCDFSNGNVVRYNLVHDNLGVGGIMVEKSSNCKVYGNIVYGETANHNANVGRGIHLSMDDGSADVNGNLIYNNTVYNCRELLVMYGAGSTKNISNNLVKNNIFLGGADNDIFYYPQGRDSGNVFDYNCLGAEPIDVDWNGAAKATYDAWETAYGGTTNSVEADPLMTDPGNDDFTLQAGSPCIDAGVNLGASYLEQLLAGSTWPAAVETMDWHKTGGAPDLGAYGYRKVIW